MIIDESNANQTEIKETGGGTIGRARASWPFAKLTVNRNMLKLSISLVGTVVFRPNDIISIEPYSGMRGYGIKINHKVSRYKSTIIFSSFGSSGLIAEIINTGFLDNKGLLLVEIEDEIAAYQASGSFPVKTSAAIFFVVVWNAFFLGGELPFFLGHTKEMSFKGAQFGLLFALLFCLCTLFVPPLRQFVLKKGREVTEIRSFLYFLLLISTLMLISFSSFN